MSKTSTTRTAGVRVEVEPRGHGVMIPRNIDTRIDRPGRVNDVRSIDQYMGGGQQPEMSQPQS